jgi:raffinose/stachyose/melibiose transport system permease protein
MREVLMAVAGDKDLDVLQAGPLTDPPAPAASRRSQPRLRRRLELVVLLAPALALFVGFVLLPIVLAAWDGMHKWTGFGSLGPFAGLYNYRLVLSDPVFRESFVHNLIIVIASILIQLPLGLGMALLLNRPVRGRAFLRTLAFAPFVLPYATTAVMWLLLLQPGGFLDQIMKAVGLGGLVQLWLANLNLVLYTMIAVLTWQFFGFAMILMLAALDGASGWQATWRITLPLLGPTIRIWLFLSVVGSLQVFDQIWIMTGGGPANASSTMVTYLVQHGFQSYEFGYGSAVAVIIFLICFIFALLYQRFVLRRDTRGALTRAVG